MYKTKKFISIILATSLLTATVGAIEVSPDTAPALDSYTLAQLPQNIRVSLTEQDQIVSVQKDDDPFSITINNQDGSKTATVFSVPVKYETTDGKMELIDTSIVSNGVLNNLFQGYQYKNKANAFTAEFSTSAEKGIRLTSEGNSITMAPAVADSVSVMTNNSTAAITAAVEEAATDDAFVYENVFGAGTRVKYYNTSLGIKEDIILDYNIGKNRFDFEIDTDGDIPILTEDAAMILVYDKDDPEQLNYRFGTLYAYDSYVGGASESGFRHLTEECYYELTQIEGSKYRITVVVPDEWLDHPELVYPVTIDPTLIDANASSTPTNIDDTYVRESAATTNYYLESRLRIGNYNGTNYTSGKCYSYVRFITLPSLTNATVLESELRMVLSSGQDTFGAARAYRVTASWSGSSLTWNNKPTHAEDTSIAMKKMVTLSNNVSTPCYVFKTAPLVNAWYNGATNYGFMIAYSNQSEQDLNSMYSSDCGISYYLPTLTFKYATNYAPITDGYYYIRNHRSGYYLDAFNAGGSGTNVGQYQFRGGKNQQWRLVHKGGGYYQISPGHNLNLSLDVSGGGNADGTNIQVYNHTVYSAQRWKIIANTNGTYRLASKCSNDTKVATVVPNYTDSGLNVIQWTYNDEYSDDNVENDIDHDESSNNGNDEWVFERALNCETYYDHGYEQRWGTETLTKLVDYQNMVAAMYYDQFNIRLRFTNTKFYSTADSCAGVTSVTINEQCEHELNGHACGWDHPDKLHHKYTDFSMANNMELGNTNMGHTTITWMGHVTCDSGCTGDNHKTGAAAGVTIDGQIAILHTTLVPRNIHSATTLAHEIGHVLGVSGGKVDTEHGDYCIMSYQNNDTSTYNRWISGNYSQSFCATCKQSLLNMNP